MARFWHFWEGGGRGIVSLQRLAWIRIALGPEYLACFEHMRTCINLHYLR